MAEDFSHIGKQIKDLELDVALKGKSQGLHADGFKIEETDFDIWGVVTYVIHKV